MVDEKQGLATLRKEYLLEKSLGFSRYHRLVQIN